MRRWFRSSIGPLLHGLRGLRKAPLPMVRQLTRLTASAFRAVIAWCATLNLKLFLQGLPALALGIGAAIVLGLALFTPTQEVEARYWDEAQGAAKARNYKEALTCYERLAFFTSDRADVLYEMALNAEADEQPERCALLMNQLAAPERKGGYAKAHLWLALRIMAQSKQTPAMRQNAESHLLMALENGVADKETAHALLGDLYLSKGLLTEAETHLLLAVKTKPQVRLRLAHLYAAQGNRTRARTEAKMAVNLFSTAAQADLFNYYARLRWADAATFLEEFPKALAILEEGLSGTGADLYRPVIARVYVTWFDLLSRTGNPNVALRLNLLERGLSYDPKNVLLLDRLLNVTRMHIGTIMTPYRVASTVAWGASQNSLDVALNLFAGSASGKEEARTTLRRLLAKGEATAQVHFALGLDAWDRGAVNEARVHWERANQLAPDLPVIVNNLAWLLYQSGPSELPKALDMINLAIAKAPRETNFRDTRGHIYLKMGKYREALEDLETALPNSPNSAAMHRSLADVYTQLEMPAMADEHKRLAASKLPVNALR